MFWRDLHKYDFCIRDFIKTTELGLPYQSDPLFRGSLNIWTICRLVVQGCTSLFCPVPRPENPSTSCGPVSVLLYTLYIYTSVLFCLLLSLYIWRRKDELFVDYWIMSYSFCFLLVLFYKKNHIRSEILYLRFVLARSLLLFVITDLNWLPARPLCLTVCFGTQVQISAPLRRSTRRRQ